MFWRLAIIALLFYLIIRLVRGSGGRTGGEGEAEEFVRDALTGVYFPRHEAVTVVRGGETLYFINLENRDRYLSSHH